MATLHGQTISLLRIDRHSNIAAANRHHARNPSTFTLLQTSDRINNFLDSGSRSLIHLTGNQDASSQQQSPSGKKTGTVLKPLQP